MKLTVLLALLLTPLLNAADPKPFAFPGLKQDIEYAKVGEVSLKLDAWVPEGEGPFPTCLLVHGGGFTKGDKHSYITPMFEPLAQAGFTWFTIDYRLAPAHRWPACADDVAAAIRWVKAHAADYKVDPARIALIGESAGGHLVSWAGVTGQGDTRVAAVVPFYAPHDLILQVQRRNALGGLGALIGQDEWNDEARKKLSEMSPIQHIQPGLPAFFQIHGDDDKQVPLVQSMNFEAKMKAAGNACETLVIPGGTHGMGGWSKLNSDYAQQMITWLKKTLK